MGGGEALPKKTSGCNLANLPDESDTDGEKRERELSSDINDRIVSLLLVIFVLVYTHVLYNILGGCTLLEEL